MKPHTLLFLSTLGLIAPATALAKPTCTPIDGYYVVYPIHIGEDPCEDEHYPQPVPDRRVWKLALDAAPDPVLLNCEHLGGDYLCEASPQPYDGTGFTYGWSTDGGAYLPWPGDPSNPFRNVSCGSFPGSVTVTITSPSGMANSASHSIIACP